MNNFTSDKFSRAFDAQTLKIGSYQNFALNHYKIRALGPVDAYIVELGVNDLRSCNGDDRDCPEYEKAIFAAKTTIDCLLESSKAKIVISLPTPTPRDTCLNKAINRFNYD